jgi:hypothetical protein
MDVLMWAQRIVATKSAPAHQLLGLPANADLDAAQEAFHKVARMAHPDLHRNGLTPEELELVTSAYATVAGAYQTFRGQVMQTTRIKRVDGGEVPATPSGPAPNANAAQSMTPRALTYYRKAELALRRGDLKGALLQIKMAIATDPQSVFLRTALAEIELEVRKGQP